MVEDVYSSAELIDIISPHAPLASSQSPTWLIVAIVMVLVIFFWRTWSWYQSERKRTIRRINQLRVAYHSQELSARELIYWLAAFLKRRLHINHLSTVIVLPATLADEQDRWQVFLHRLHELRYSPCSCSEQDINFLLAEAKFWVRRWP